MCQLSLHVNTRKAETIAICVFRSFRLLRQAIAAVVNVDRNRCKIFGSIDQTTAQVASAL